MLATMFTSNKRATTLNITNSGPEIAKLPASICAQGLQEHNRASRRDVP